MMRRAVGALVVLVLAGCAASPNTSSPLTIMAAASLANGIDDDASANYNFAGSQQLAAQLQAGARADVVVTADESSMAKLVDSKLVDTPVIVATNSMAIAVYPGNPKHIAGLADLARSDVVVVLADPTVPAGKYAAEVLKKAGVTVKLASLELDVESAVQKVALKQADAAVVYKTSADTLDVDDVPVPADVNVVTRYPAAVVKATKARTRAEAFVAALPRRLQRAGYGSP
jgi:molybdate transport system substrate-binding protein